MRNICYLRGNLRGDFRQVEIFANKQSNYVRRHAPLLWPLWVIDGTSRDFYEYA